MCNKYNTTEIQNTTHNNILKRKDNTEKSPTKDILNIYSVLKIRLKKDNFQNHSIKQSSNLKMKRKHL